MTPLLSFITGAAIAALCLAIARRHRKRSLMLLTDVGTSLVMSLRLAQAAERKAKAKAKAARPACPVLPPATQELPAWGDSGRWWKTRRPAPLTPRAK